MAWRGVVAEVKELNFIPNAWEQKKEAAFSHKTIEEENRIVKRLMKLTHWINDISITICLA